jgi:hypothetical protein
LKQSIIIVKALKKMQIISEIMLEKLQKMLEKLQKILEKLQKILEKLIKILKILQH